MAKILVVTSGKGGVGKTTTSAAIGTGLALRGFKTVIVDFDVGLRNLDLIMGCERRVVYDFVNVVNGEATLTQALIKDKRLENLHVLAASQTRDKDALTKEGVEKVMAELRKDFEYIICDSPAGIEKGAHLAMYFADEAIVVTNPEVSSVRDSDRMLGLLASKSQRAEKGEEPIKEHLLLTRYNPERVTKGEMLGVDDVEEILAIRLLGVIPESQAVLKASNQGVPVILDEQSDAGQATAMRSTACSARKYRIDSSMCRRKDSCKDCSEDVNEPFRLLSQSEIAEQRFHRERTTADHRCPRTWPARTAGLSAPVAERPAGSDPQVRTDRPGADPGGTGEPGQLLDPGTQHHPAGSLIRPGSILRRPLAAAVVSPSLPARLPAASRR